ncbi:transglutaminase domain-containing protein [Aquihabitans sp. G128]|uniref:transglutaminase domain-containing protein n=1 Tax=Aquihabitans sp. G128 TaxID=2849779 RepID=UPI001C250234|nr:transglutaminase domain-containing protein [Aquihabitans sp. G128]QXC61381.1 transglutaminase domain-containing protein [Aquihabitans sp. G128]
MSVLARLARAALALAVLAAAAPALAHVYGPGWLVPVAGAALASVLVDLVVRLAVERRPAVVLVPVHLLGALLWTSAAVRPGLDGATAVGGATDGVARLLTAIPPVDARGPELGLAVLVAWIAGALTAAACARPRPTLLAAVPVLAVFAAALVLGDPRAVLGDGVALALVAAVGAVLLVGQAAPRGGAGLVRPVGAVAVVAVAGLAALALGPTVADVGDRDRIDVRERVQPPVDVALAENPLDAVPTRRSAERPPTRFTARVDLPAGAGDTLRWHVAVLDRVGPQGWTRSEAAFQRAGRSLGPVPADQAEDRAIARLDVRLGEPVPGLPLLPTPDRPISASPSGLAFDARSGELAVPTGVDRPARVQLQVALPTTSAAELASAQPVRRAVPTGLPPAVLARAQRAAGTSPSGFDRLAAIRRSLRDDRSLRLDPSLVASTANSEVARLLGPAGKEPRTANQAQLAATFAQLARAQGFDARLAVGYVTPVAAGRSTIRATGAQLSVWPEVRFAGLGWVPFTISAPRGGGTEATAPDPTEAGTSAADQAADQRADAAEAERREPATPRTRPDRRGGTDGGSTSPWPVVGALVALALVAALAWAPIARWRRRRTRRRGDGRIQVLGAWDEALDQLREAGVVVAADLTRPDVVAVVAATGQEAEAVAELNWLAARCDQLGFAGGAATATAEEVGRAWRAVGVVARSARSSRSRPERARAFATPPRRLRTAVEAPRRHGRRLAHG